MGNPGGRDRGRPLRLTHERHLSQGRNGVNIPDVLTPLKDRRFAWYYAGRVISTTGSTMAPVALTFAVLDLTDNSPTALGMVLAANSIPMVVFLLIGGVVADRFSRSVVLQVSHLLSALTRPSWPACSSPARGALDGDRP